MSKKASSFVKGAAILGAAGLGVKVIGMFFRVFLTNIIGADGIANYQVAYPYYAWLVVISTAGLPAAISRMVSERVSIGDYRGAHKVFQIALKMLSIIGIISTIAMLLLSNTIADATTISSASLSLKMIAPSLFFVAIMSAYRGYFQGLQSMTPTALTQIVEQLIKLGAGMALAMLWAPKGIEYGAAGALLGVSISELCALIVIIIIYNRKKTGIRELRLSSGSAHAPSGRSIIRNLVVIALPVTLAASIMPIVQALDSLLVTNLLSSIDYSAFNPLEPKTSFGVLTGAVNTLVNMPAVLSLALCMSLVPAISEARTRKNVIAVGTRTAMGFKLALLIGLPCAIGMYLLAEPIITLLYSRGLTAEEIAVGAELLRIMSLGVLFLTMLQTMSGILQGAGRQFIPLITLLIGAIVKVVLSLTLIRIPELNINGAAISTAACYGIAAILNVIFVIRVTRPNIKPVSGVLMPAISSGVMGIITYLMYKTLLPNLGNTKSLLLTIAGAIVVYVVLLFITGSLQKEDMSFLPGGSAVIRFMNKLGFWSE